MIYGYRCRNCGRQEDSTTRGDTLGVCPTLFETSEGDGNRHLYGTLVEKCSGELRRDFGGVGFGKVETTEHFNKTTSSWIRTDKQFDEKMRVESDRASLQTGMAHRYERVDPDDKKALGVTDEGMDATNRARHAQGLRQVK